MTTNDRYRFRRRQTLPIEDAVPEFAWKYQIKCLKVLSAKNKNKLPKVLEVINKR
jgi:hypothetical protein